MKNLVFIKKKITEILSQSLFLIFKYIFRKNIPSSALKQFRAVRNIVLFPQNKINSKKSSSLIFSWNEIFIAYYFIFILKIFKRTFGFYKKSSNFPRYQTPTFYIDVHKKFYWHYHNNWQPSIGYKRKFKKNTLLKSIKSINRDWK